MRSAGNISLLVRGVGLVATALPGALIAAPVPPDERTIHSQPSWVLATNGVEVAITKRGGHMAPVTFDRKAAAPIRPNHVSPWQDENLTDLPAAVLVPGEPAEVLLPRGVRPESQAQVRRHGP